VLFGSLASAAQAAIVTAYAPLDFNGNAWSGGHSQNQSFGDRFTPTVDILVVSLGYLDYEEDGLLEDFEIGIFRNIDQALLVSTLLPDGASGTLIDRFRYLDVAPTLLHAGTEYTIAAHTNANLDVTGRTQVTGISLDPAISVTAPANYFKFPIPGLQYPDGGPGTGEFYIGPNFRFTTTIATPEPVTTALMAMTVPLGIGLRVIRRRRVAA
jgi:hypothetical protein